ncbi:MAG: hypothetical protein RLZZ488_561 [Pseudomonadota bacterium]
MTVGLPIQNRRSVRLPPDRQKVHIEVILRLANIKEHLFAESLGSGGHAMILNSDKSMKQTNVQRKLKLVSLSMTFAVVSACGFLANPDRAETPSRLLLEAQAAYDTGDYAKAQSLLEKVIVVDPSNDEARIRLAFAYNGTLGITPIELIKSFAGGSTGGSSSSDITSLTSKSSLPDKTIEELKENASATTSVSELRAKIEEFATFQKAFLAICPLFSKETMSALKTKAASALDLLEVSKCGDGRDRTDANVSIAALSMALGQFSSLYKAILDANGDGKFDLEVRANAAKTSIDGLNTAGGDIAANVATLTRATDDLNYVLSQLQGEVFKLAISQFSIIDAVIGATNLPASIKSGISKGIDGLNSALNNINSYLDAGKSEGGTAKTGTATAEAADKAKAKANEIIGKLDPINNPDDQKKIDDLCTSAFCLNKTAGVGLPTSCDANKPYVCTSTPTIPPQQ